LNPNFRFGFYIYKVLKDFRPSNFGLIYSPKMGICNLLELQKFLDCSREAQRNKFNGEPALSFVPEALAPPNGCCPTTAPVGLSLI
jgi:hypothetical protein